MSHVKIGLLSSNILTRILYPLSVPYELGICFFPPITFCLISSFNAGNIRELYKLWSFPLYILSTFLFLFSRRRRGFKFQCRPCWKSGGRNGNKAQGFPTPASCNFPTPPYQSVITAWHDSPICGRSIVCLTPLPQLTTSPLTSRYPQYFAYPRFTFLRYTQRTRFKPT